MESDLTIEECEARAGEIFSDAIVTGLGDSKWKNETGKLGGGKWKTEHCK